MNILHGRLASAVVLSALTMQAAAHVPEYLEPYVEVPDLEPMVIVDRFLEAVARGELAVFGTPITRDRVVPRRVHFVYDLETRESAREVYADLDPPVPVPGQAGCEVRGIDALLDAFGEIVESAAHVWCD